MYERTQAIVGDFLVRALHTRLDDLARLLCPVIRHFRSGFYWTLMQVEYATDVTIFKHHRMVEHRDGTQSKKTAPVKKSIFSLGIMAKLMEAANRRYLDFLAALDDPSDGVRKLPKVAKPVRRNGRSVRSLKHQQANRPVRRATSS